MPIYETYWQLEYGKGTLLRTEPGQGETILHAPKGYTGLRLVNVRGEPVIRIDIPDGARAIFYRVRSVAVQTDGRHALDNNIRLDGTVFGYGRIENMPGGEVVNTKLWVWHRGKALDCPPHLIRQGAIDLAMTAPLGT